MESRYLWRVEAAVVSLSPAGILTLPFFSVLSAMSGAS